MKKKNILLITSDQQHFNTIGAFNKEISTPNLDRLVHEGTYFDRAYCPNPTCTPTRASLITGQYASQHGAWTLGVKLPESALTIGALLQKEQYKTALIGKAHFQPLESTEEYPSLEAYPLLQDLEYWKNFNEDFYGFDHVELARNHTNEAHVGQHYALWMEEKGLKDWRKYFRKPTGEQEDVHVHHWDIPEEYHYDAWIAERTNAMLEQYNGNDEGFFLWASFFDPHPQYLVPSPWDKMYDPDKLTLPTLTKGEHEKNPPHFQMTQTKGADFSQYTESGYFNHGMHVHLHEEKEMRQNIATYYGMVSLMDKYIGKILDKLDELGIAQDTLIIFTTDHGHFLGHHGLMHKGPFMYEDLIKVPFIVKGQGVPADKVSSAIQSLVDVVPTCLDWLELPIPPVMTGLSQKQVWLGEKEEVRECAIVEHHHEPTTIHLKTYVDKRYKITVYYNQTYGELFDLEKDPGEINNLWDNPDYAALKSELLLKYIWAELGKEPMWMPRIAHA